MIPVCAPLISSQDRDVVLQCLENNEIANGKYIELFEKQWASYNNRLYGVAVSNGTNALQLAIEAIGLKAGDQVIVPSFTIMSCALAVIRCGATPVFVDVDDYWCLNPIKVAKVINAKTKAIMVVHMYGNPASMKQLIELCENNHLYLIEDAAQAHGASYDGYKCGSFGIMSCFSFYANKLITTGEGGMILTNDKAINEQLRSKRNLCFGQSHDRFIHTGCGYNFRMTNLQAALGYSQALRIDQIIQIKRIIGERYRNNLLNIKGITLQNINHCSSYWMNGLLVNDPKDLSKYLSNNGVDSRPFFSGLHAQKSIKYAISMDCRKTEYLSNHGLYLPSGLDLTIEQIDFICGLIKEYVNDQSL